MITFLLAIALILACIAPLIPPTAFMLPALLGIVFPYLVIANIITLFFWLLTRHKRYAALPLVCLLIAIPQAGKIVSLTTSSEKDTKHKITLMTYNTQRLGGTEKGEKNAVLRYIKQQNADIVCLQEFETNKLQQYLTLQDVKTYLNYPYSYIDYKIYRGNRQYGLAIFSRYPLINKTTVQYESQANESDYCDVVIDTDTIRLFNNHLQSYRLLPAELQVTEVNREELEGKARGLFSKMRVAYEYREKQVKTMKDRIQQSPYPVIVVGDFNEPPISYTYRKLSHGLRDAHLSGTRLSLGQTYSHRGLAVRIDYILCSKSINATRTSVDRVPYSDHFPLTTTLCW